MAVNGIGRPSKGHRIRMVTRVDPLTHLLATRLAAKEDLTISEWLEQVVTIAVGRRVEVDA